MVGQRHSDAEPERAGCPDRNGRGRNEKLTRTDHETASAGASTPPATTQNSRHPKGCEWGRGVHQSMVEQNNDNTTNDENAPKRRSLSLIHI